MQESRREQRWGVIAVALWALVGTGVASAAGKTYQVTGPVESVTDSMVVVQKGKEKWELARDASTKVKGDLKPGAKVTVEYRMTATNIDVKGEKAAAAHKKSKATR